MQTRSILPSTWKDLAAKIEISCLAVDARERDLRLACLEAQKYAIRTVVVNPVNVRLAAQICQGTEVQVGVAISYPVGGYLPDFKALEVQEAVEDGAREIYMLMAVGAFREAAIQEQTIPEITGMQKAAGTLQTTLITEGSVLTSEQIIKLVQIAAENGVHNLAVCSGFDRSRLPEISDQVIGEFARANRGTMGLVYMGRVKGLAHAERLFNLGITRLCTPDMRLLLQGYPAFPYK